MAGVRDGWRNAIDGFSQMGDVGAYVTVAAGDHLRQSTAVVGGNKRQSVQFPGYPDGLSLSPFYEVSHLLGLRQREGGKLVFLLLAADAVF